MSVTNRQMIGILKESGSYGNSPFTGSYAPVEWFAASNISIKPQVTIIENEDITAGFSGRKSLTSPKACDVTVDFKITGRTGSVGGPAASEAYWSPFVYGAGFESTLVAGSPASIEYNPSANSAAGSSITIVDYQIHDDNVATSRKHVARGVRGNLTYNFAIDQVAKASFTGRGMFYDLPAGTTTTPTLPASYSGEDDAYICKGATFTIGGTAYCIESMDISTNWGVNDDNCMTTDGSVSEVFLGRGTGARIGGSMTLKGNTNTLSTILPAIAAGTEFAVVWSLSSSAAGEVEWAMPAVQFVDYSESANGQRFNYAMTFAANGVWDGSSEKGDNELIVAIK